MLQPWRSHLRVFFTVLLTLSWWSALSNAAPTDIPSAASFWVPSLPDIHQDPVHPLHIYAGPLSSDPHASEAQPNDITAHLYFVLVQNRRTADKERVMFWFNGGPGCSSFDGLMMEVGPWRMDGKGGFKVTEGGWEEYTTMVYVDQPAGTGFSYTSSNHYVHTLQEGSEQWLEFLRNFYKVFPQYKRMDTYLGGESFAGQYIPYYADALLNSDLGVPLKGAAIGNGWIDARRQYPSFLEYTVKAGILEENSDLYKDAKQKTDACMVKVNEITDKEPINVRECESLLLDVTKVRQRKVENKDMCINIYDVRLDDIAPACGMNWPPDIKPITKYLDRPDVVRALHAEAHSESWIECRGRIHKELHESQSNSSITVLPRVLEKIPVLIFAGDQDLICNYIGLEAMINALTWNGGTGLGTVQTQSWNVDGVAAGTWVSSRNLTYTKIFNASHMAPFDVPHITHDMILRFMGVDFASILEGSAKIPSSVGSETKPMYVKAEAATATSVPTGKTPQQDKAMWEAYYNAGSTALVLILIVICIGLFIWWRKRQARAQTLHLPLNQSEAEAEESIPLTRREQNDSVQEFRPRKGKERALDSSSALSSPNAPIFDVGSDDEDDQKYRDK
ncbi:Alpha/Beta hydrolase protein [Lentinula boryana]|uniref:Pheromone-processing carboxypeptidase KEX1 n=1 Tax=Lentinula boryana TaxID=40481 RepID=A0ABQ8Q5B7_9AGAR|nr:Alpha/Beta hydrolase protein [Lentinula boryana]